MFAMGFSVRDCMRHGRHVLGVCFCITAASAVAAETDNFSIPLDVEFADLGDFMEALHTDAIESGVAMVNSRIERALNLKDSKARQRKLDHWHSPATLSKHIAAQFGEAPLEKVRIEGALTDAWAAQAFPGATVLHHDKYLNLHGRGAMDPRALLMLVQSGTLKAFGVYFGTDKLVHFHQLGQQYYKRYQGLLDRGVTPQEARQQVLDYFSKEAFLAEDRGFGTLLSGIYSNADMAANYLGFKFMLNLTEPVMLEGSEHEPLILRCGVYWRLNDHVRPHSGWFRPFLSDHWNEALNPNLYTPNLRPHVRQILEERADPIVEFYTSRDGRPREAHYFEHLNHQLSTYHGEPYGHLGHSNELMNLGNTCFPALSNAETAATASAHPIEVGGFDNSAGSKRASRADSQEVSGR
jgi:hypothetical protein